MNLDPELLCIKMGDQNPQLCFDVAHAVIRVFQLSNLVEGKIQQTFDSEGNLFLDEDPKVGKKLQYDVPIIPTYILVQ